MSNLIDISYFDPSQLDSRIESGEYFNENYDSLESNRLKSNTQSATYNQFIKLMSKIIDITNEGRELPISFMSVSSYEKAKDIAVPIITYKTVHRSIFQKELRPRFRETVNDENNPSKTINVYGQKFDYLIEFKIMDSSDENAENTMSELEDLLLMYYGYFQSQGVSNIRFVEQGSDEQIQFKEQLYTKAIQYGVVLEKITLISEEKINTIISRINSD